VVYFLLYWFVCVQSYITVLVKLFELCSTQEKVEKENNKSINARVMHLKYDIKRRGH